MDVESQGSEPNEQSNDKPPEFTGTKPSEFKSYRKKVKLWLLFTLQLSYKGHFFLSRLTGPACDGLEPEDVATDDGVNVILDTLAEAFQGEHERELFDALEDTFYGPGRKKGEASDACCAETSAHHETSVASLVNDLQILAHSCRGLAASRNGFAHHRVRIRCRIWWGAEL